MSITSSNDQELNPNFANLLAQHTGLADWLLNVLHSGTEHQAASLLSRFLAECAAQGIPESAYPFIAEDQAQADLQAYIQRGEEEVDAVQHSMSDQGQSEQTDAPALHESNTPGESSEDKTPLISAISNEMVTESQAEKTPAEQVVEEDVAQLATAHIPALSLPLDEADTAQQPVPEKVLPAQDEEHPGQVFPAPVPGVVHGANEAEEDVAQLMTAHMPAVALAVDKAETTSATATEGADTSAETAEDAARTEIASGDVAKKEEVAVHAGASSVKQADVEAITGDAEEDVAQQETAHIPATPAASDNEIADKAESEPTAQVVPQGSPAPTRRVRKSKRPRRPRTRRQLIVTWVVLIAVLGTILVPAIFLVNFGLNAYNTYHELSNQAHTAVNHLMDVKTTFSNGGSSKSQLSGFLDTGRLQRAEQDFILSGRDFQQLQNQLKQSSTLHTVTTYFPQYRETLASAQAASQIGIDVARIGQIATSHAAQIAPTFSGSLLASSGKPLVTQPLLDTINTTIDQVTPLLKDVELQSQNVSLDSLPISASEKLQVGQLLPLLPQVITDLGLARSMLGDAGWLLGVNQPRTFLVQTMDRAELRGAGGFTGQYGELTINGGRIAPFSLKDISLVEYTDSSVTQGQSVLAPYRSWWPFANWGLRDSNISADFPTTAQVALNLYKQETGHQVDGVISFTPVVIEHILAIIGPIQVPGYNTTVTSQNLEDMLHYYQLDNRGILKQILNQPNNTSTSQRKRFTNYLTTLMMAKVRSSSTNQFVAIAHQVLADLSSKDLQVYLSDPATESVLAKYGYAGQLDRSTTHDGFYVDQQNLSASKASQYVQTILHDTVTLDSKGGATHMLQIRLVYNQAGPVYGYDTYYDYLRVYVPTSSQLLSGDGFSSGTPLCGGAYGDCPVNGPYSAGEMTCPAGQYQPGASPPSLTQPDGGTWEPLQTLGRPTNTTSDEPGRAMYGGWVIVPKNCTMNVTLSWYVPPISTQPYSLLVQRQAGTFPELDLSILPDAADCTQLGTSGLHYDNTLTKDQSFALPAYQASAHTQGKQSCYPRSGV